MAVPVTVAEWYAHATKQKSIYMSKSPKIFPDKVGPRSFCFSSGCLFFLWALRFCSRWRMFVNVSYLSVFLCITMILFVRAYKHLVTFFCMRSCTHEWAHECVCIYDNLCMCALLACCKHETRAQAHTQTHIHTHTHLMVCAISTRKHYIYYTLLAYILQ